MASKWANNLPVVTVRMTDRPKRVTFVYPYYASPIFLGAQDLEWRKYASDLTAHLAIVVVDDGSPRPAQKPDLPFCRLFRIEIDLPWNWLAARNIGAHHAEAGWLLLTDMDHVVPDRTLRSLIYGKHDPKIVYAFRREEHTGELIPPHSASFFLTRDLFWRIGGYDEALSGHYGTDGEFRKRLRKFARVQVLTDPLIRYEYVGDSSTTRYARKRPEDALAVKQLVAARGPGWRPKVLSFPYREVTA